ncbi:MAG TPA: hypothetical protein QGG37_11645 [Chloroflexota bacterium]|nr:hypothetical protein [Chloroflexota bacterium]
MPRLKVVGAGSPTRTGKRWGTCFLLEIDGDGAEDGGEHSAVGERHVAVPRCHGIGRAAGLLCQPGA